MREKRPESADGGSVVEIYLRSLSDPSPHQYQQGLLQQVEQLAQHNAIDGYRIDFVGEKLCSCEECASVQPTRSRLDRIGQWQEWAAENGVSLLLDEYSVSSSLTGEAYEFVVPPTVTLVHRVDGDIKGVYPNRAGGETQTPMAYLSASLTDVSDHSTVSPDTEKSVFQSG